MGRRRVFSRHQPTLSTIEAALANKQLIIDSISQGLVAEQIALIVGANTAAIRSWIKILGLQEEYRKAKTTSRRTPDERTEKIHEMITNGATLQQVGEAFGITRERVRQILKRFYNKSPRDIRPVNKERVCENCGSTFLPQKSAQRICTRSCQQMHRLKNVWTRDMAVKIMQMRSQICTWDEVAKTVMPSMNPDHFRMLLQHVKPIIFSSEEIKFYFPKRGEDQWPRKPDSRIQSDP